MPGAHSFMTPKRGHILTANELSTTYNSVSCRAYVHVLDFIAHSLDLQAETNKRHPSFFCHSLCGPIWMVFDGPKTQHDEHFSRRRSSFLFWFGRKKNPKSQNEISVVNSDFFLPNKKIHTVGKKFAMFGFRSTKNHPNRPA